MVTTRVYLKNSDQTEIKTKLTDIGQDDSGPWIRLDETIFHPKGGGQPGDKGWCNDIPILDTQFSDKQKVDINHYVEGSIPFKVGEDVLLKLDVKLRQNHARLHSSGHLLADIISEILPEIKPYKGNHFPNQCSITCKVPEGYKFDTNTLITEINSKAITLIEDDLTTKVNFDDDGKRSFQIGNYKAVGCGGTHVKSTSLLKGLIVTKLKLKKCDLKISYNIEED